MSQTTESSIQRYLRISRRDQLEEKKEKRIVRISGEDIKDANNPDVVETSGLGTCLGVIIYDPVTKKALAGHTFNPAYGNFEDLLITAQNKFQDISRLKVYVGGMALYAKDAPKYKYDTKKRNYVRSKLLAIFSEQQLDIRFQEANQCTVMRLDTETGEIAYDISTYQDQDNY